MQDLITIDFPQDTFKMVEGTFDLRFFKNMYVSRLGVSRPSAAGSGHALWAVDVSIATMTVASSKKWQARRARYIDNDLAFRIYDPQRYLPEGSGAGFKTTNTELLFVGTDLVERSVADGLHWIGGKTYCTVYEAADRYASSVVLDGLPANELKVFKEGDFIELGGNLYMVVADANSDANGRTRIEIKWKLWKPALVGDVVKFDNPSGRFVMVDPESAQVVKTPGFGTGAQLIAMEHPYT